MFGLLWPTSGWVQSRRTRTLFQFRFTGNASGPVLKQAETTLKPRRSQAGAAHEVGAHFSEKRRSGALGTVANLKGLVLGALACAGNNKLRGHAGDVMLEVADGGFLSGDDPFNDVAD